jgi:hypothetical protein
LSADAAREADRANDVAFLDVEDAVGSLDRGRGRGRGAELGLEPRAAVTRALDQEKLMTTVTWMIWLASTGIEVS